VVAFRALGPGGRGGTGRRVGAARRLDCGGEGRDARGAQHRLGQDGAEAGGAAGAAALRLKAFVQDERRTAEVLVTLPLTVFLLDRPRNRGLALPGLTRVRDWAEVLTHFPAVSGILPV
jgi:hypothetical protein